ncbi:hypothetical protein D3C79_930520 [compost metagenome]
MLVEKFAHLFAPAIAGAVRFGLQKMRFVQVLAGPVAYLDANTLSQRRRGICKRECTDLIGLERKVAEQLAVRLKCPQTVDLAFLDVVVASEGLRGGGIGVFGKFGVAREMSGLEQHGTFDQRFVGLDRLDQRSRPGHAGFVGFGRFQ